MPDDAFPLRSSRVFVSASTHHPRLNLWLTSAMRPFGKTERGALTVTRRCVVHRQLADEGTPMNSNLTSTLSEFSKGRPATERSNHPPLLRTSWNLITKVRLSLGK